MKTVVRLSGTGGELDKIVLDYEVVTTEEIAVAAITLVQRGGYVMNVGDTITVTEED